MQESSEIAQKLIPDVKEFLPEKKIYFNGFSISFQPADCMIVLLHNDQSIALLNTTHVVAKSLAENLNKLIVNFEENTGQTISKFSELIDKLSEKKSP